MSPNAEGLLDELRRAQLPAPRVRRQIREDAGATIRDLSAALGVTPMTVHRWESGQVAPTREHAIQYRELLEGLEEVQRAS